MKDLPLSYTALCKVLSFFGSISRIIVFLVSKSINCPFSIKRELLDLSIPFVLDTLLLLVFVIVLNRPIPRIGDVGVIFDIELLVLLLTGSIRSVFTFKAGFEFDIFEDFEWLEGFVQRTMT